MESVTTIALLTKKEGMSTSLFSRYWRDVHGVLAARIPGFESYVQFHLGKIVHNLLSLPDNVSSSIPAGSRFHGIAEVAFRNERDRSGLVASDVAALIQEDEQNVFKTSLLYNLTHAASRTYIDTTHADDGRTADGQEPVSLFMLLGRRPGYTGEDLIAVVEQTLVPALSRYGSVLKLRMHGLASGDPRLWNTTGVDNEQTPATSFDAVIQIVGSKPYEILECLKTACSTVSTRLFEVAGKVHAYQVDASYVMVRGGRPTHLGLRGRDVMQTIDAAGARNQREDAVLRCVYGASVADS